MGWHRGVLARKCGCFGTWRRQISTNDRTRDAMLLLRRRHASKSHATGEERESRNSVSLLHLFGSRYLRGWRPGPSSISTRNRGVPIEKEVLSDDSA